MNMSTALDQARASALVTAIGSGSTINIYTGSAPANANATATGTLLVTLTIAGAFGTASAGVVTLGAVTAGTAVATGTAGWARCFTSAAAVMFDMSNVTVTGGGGDLTLNSLSITSGGTVSITSGTETEPS